MATVFEIMGPLAMFRKPYTTTSTASFPIPPPTALAGLIAAISGIENGAGQAAASARYWQALAGTSVAVQRLNPPGWYATTINFWNTKNPQKNPHIQVKHQFVRKPHYRVFVQGGVEERLREMLAAGAFYYTPTLGTAYALADVVYLGSFDYEAARLPRGQKSVRVASAVPVRQDADLPIDYLASKGLMMDTFPFRLDAQRALQETIHLLYPSTPQGRIVLDIWEELEITRYGEDAVAWLPQW